MLDIVIIIDNRGVGIIGGGGGWMGLKKSVGGFLVFYVKLKKTVKNILIT